MRLRGINYDLALATTQGQSQELILCGALEQINTMRDSRDYVHKMKTKI